MTNYIPFIDGISRQYTFQTENQEFYYTCIPTKGRDYNVMERNFNWYKEENDNSDSLILYRTFKKNPLCFWRYKNYLTDPMYNYPYLPE